MHPNVIRFPSALGVILSFVQIAIGFRCVSYNIRSGDNVNGVFNLNNTAEIIRQLNPDIVGLQEVDRFTSRHPIDEPSFLANQTNMYSIFAKMRSYEGGDYGICILSRNMVLDSRIFHYRRPGEISQWKKALECSGDPVPGDYCQGALAVLIEVSPSEAKLQLKTNSISTSKKIWFVTTHLGLYDMQLNESMQLFEFLNSLMSVNAPIVITGDMNSTPESDAIQFLTRKANMIDQWASCGKGFGYTFSSDTPTRRIDYQFTYSKENVTTNGIRCIQSFLINTLASDHLPVTTDYLLDIGQE